MTAAIVDTGPLVAFLDENEKHHRWVVERIKALDVPLLVCEPVYRKHGRVSLKLVYPE